jgi:N-acetylglucosaminyldiphosphoundecaprenol N-acetyl-beta-D-mannosaminyltransferase
MNEANPNKIRYSDISGAFIIEQIFRAILRYCFSIAVVSCVFLPVLFYMLFRKLLTGKRVFLPENLLGKGAEPLRVYVFNSKSRPVNRLPLFLWVLAGKFKLVGLSKKSADFPRTDGDEYLFSDNPGIFTLFYLRESTRITHKPQARIDEEYLGLRSLRYDFFLVLRCIPAIFYSSAGHQFKEKVDLLGVEFDNITMAQALNLIKNTIIAGKRRFICFVNPDCLNKIFTDGSYSDILRRADNVFPDGIGINIGCKLIKNPMRENINGTDMLPFLCELCSQNGWGMYFLGAAPGVAEKMSELLVQRYPALKICGYRHGFFDGSQNDEVVADINRSGAKLPLVALGVPMQEKWIARNRGTLNIPVVMGVGGLFDFYSGNIRRAPIWLRELGCEWIYRILQEPGRMWKRYVIGNPVFLYRVIKWKRQKYR